MTTTSPNDLPKEVVGAMLQIIEEESKSAARFWWKVLLDFLSENWIWIFVFAFAILVFVSLKAMLGRWGSLGSFLYNFFYFGILFVVGLVFGPEVFVADMFNAVCAIVLYPVCYWVVGLILNKLNLKRSNRF